MSLPLVFSFVVSESSVSLLPFSESEVAVSSSALDVSLDLLSVGVLSSSVSSFFLLFESVVLDNSSSFDDGVVSSEEFVLSYK
jgi:hypothetical protein